MEVFTAPEGKSGLQPRTWCNNKQTNFFFHPSICTHGHRGVEPVTAVLGLCKSQGKCRETKEQLLSHLWTIWKICRVEGQIHSWTESSWPLWMKIQTASLKLNNLGFFLNNLDWSNIYRSLRVILSVTLTAPFSLRLLFLKRSWSMPADKRKAKKNILHRVLPTLTEGSLR